jgi:hypothetical protein
MHSRVVLGALAAAVAAIAVLMLVLRGSTGDDGPNPGHVNRASGTLTDRQIADIATRFAKANGDSTPTSIVALAAPHRAAIDAAMPGSEISDDGIDVDVIVIRGHFTGDNTKAPQAHRVPTGKVITLVIDDSSGQVTDWSLGNHDPDLSSLGTQTRLAG